MRTKAIHKASPEKISNPPHSSPRVVSNGDVILGCNTYNFFSPFLSYLYARDMLSLIAERNS